MDPLIVEVVAVYGFVVDGSCEHSGGLEEGKGQIAQANQMDLVCPGRDDQKVAVLNGLKSGKVKRSDLERSATRILRMIRANTEVPMRV